MRRVSIVVLSLVCAGAFGQKLQTVSYSAKQQTPPPPVLLVLLAPQPTAVIAASEIRIARRAPQRRRRGTISKSTHASVAPDPAAYQGAVPEGLAECGAESATERSRVAITKKLNAEKLDLCE